MTNPVLHVSVDDMDDNYLESVSLVSTEPASFELQDTWIPAASTANTQQHSNMARVLQYKVRAPASDAADAEQAWFPASSSPNKWRKCRYRRRVGQGQECYERVREAALGWQFQHPAKGIIPVCADKANEKSKNDCFALNDEASRQVQPLWSGPHSQGSRRLVTFTKMGFKTRWLPKLYTMNPVMVVYDLLDQRYVLEDYAVCDVAACDVVK